MVIQVTFCVKPLCIDSNLGWVYNMAISLLKGFSGNNAGDGPSPTEERHIKNREDSRNQRILEQRQLRYSQAERTRNSATRRTHRARIAAMHRNVSTSRVTNSNVHHQDTEFAAEILQSRRMQAVLQRRNAYAGLLPEQLRSFTTNADTALLYWHSIQAPCTEGDLGEYLLPISDSEKDIRIRKFYKHMHPDEVYGCACCGVRVIRDYEDDWPSDVDISNLQCLQLNEQQQRAYADDGTYRFRNIVRIKNVDCVPSHDEYYFLHRRYLTIPFATIDDDNEALVKDMSIKARMCDPCRLKCQIGKIPTHSVAVGVDYGLPISVSLPTLSLLECLLIQKTRIFCHILKLSGGKREYALSGHCIASATDAAYTTSTAYAASGYRTLPDANINRIGLSVMFIGKLDKWRRITNERRINEIIVAYGSIFYVKWENIIMWLTHLRNVNPYYRDIVIDESENTQALVLALPVALLHDTHITENDTCISIDATLRTANMGCPQLDVSTNQRYENSSAHAGDSVDNAEDTTFIPIQHVLLESGVENTMAESTILQSAINSLSDIEPSAPTPHGLSNLGHDQPPISIGHSRDLLNSYTEMKFLMSTGFPTLFPLGYPFGDWPPSPQQLVHMLTQADNRCSSNLEFIMFSFNIRSRSHVAKSVAARWRASPSSIQKLQDLLGEPNFHERLKDAAINPKTDSARNILKTITPLIVLGSANVPYRSPGRNTLALTHMIAMHRFFGSSMSWFFTMNPNMTNHVLSYRLSTPVSNNWDRENPLIPDTNTGRRDLLEGSPIGPSLAYTRLYHAVWDILFNFPASTLTTPTPACYRTRGIIGQISGYYSCQETSNAGYQHQHCQIYAPLNWTVLRTCIHNPELNRKVGVYVDSIVWSELRYNDLHGWSLKDVPLSNPLDIHEALATPTYNVNVFLYRSCFHATKIQDHFFHNHSCWKNRTGDNDKCRFKLPSASWNQESGVLCLKGVFDIDNKLVGSKICCSVPEPDIASDVFYEDSRVLVFESTKRSSDDAVLRTFDDLYVKSSQNPGLFHLDDDPSSTNGFFTPCIQAITATTHDQNNIQIVNGTMGAAQYIAKYIAKGDGTKLQHTLPLFYEAVTTSALYPSTASDTDTNALRPALRTLNRIINNNSRACEFSMRLMLNSLLGEDQFSSSHCYRFVYVNAARIRLMSCTVNASDIPNSPDFSRASTQSLDWETYLVEDDYQGEFVRRNRNTDTGLVIVTQYDDYRFRPQALANFNLSEFACIFRKKLKASGESGDSINVRHDNIDTANVPRGRRFNASYEFQSGHPQFATHRLVLSSMLGVPILTGNHVPSKPKFQMDGTDISESDYNSQLNDFGSYFVTLLCPWDIVSGTPPYNLSYSGLIQFIHELTSLNDVPETTISINAGRLRYMQNCVAFESPLSRYHSDVSRFHRERAATTYASYQAYVRTVGGNDSQFEATVTNESTNLDINANNISDLIDNLRSRFDMLEDMPLSNSEKQQLHKNDITCLNISELFGVHNCPAISQDMREHNISFATTSISLPSLTSAWDRLTHATHRNTTTTVLHPIALPLHISTSDGTILPQANISPSIPSCISLNAEQNTVLSRWVNMSIQKLELVTGMPGTGKTFLASRITELYGTDKCRVIAPTGKAADLHDGGNTAHSAFALPINEKFLKPLSAKQATLMRQKFNDMQILIIDEISMLHAGFLPMISDRLQELFPHLNGKDFAGVSVLLLGDFLQLPPVGSWLIDHAISGHSTAAILFRKFRHTILRQQMRAADDPIHTALLQRLSDPLNYPHPLRGINLFVESCIRCLAPIASSSASSHTCYHLKVLTPTDTLNDVCWSNAIITSPTNTAVNKINWERLVTYAHKTGQPILRWRLPSLSTSLSLRLSGDAESQHVDLFGYYVKGAPIKITFNANVDIGVSNGTTGTLHSLVPFNSAILTEILLTYTSGQIITLDPPPLAVLVELHAQRHPASIPSLSISSTVFPLLVRVKDVKRKLIINLGKDSNGKLEYPVVGAGYAIAFACTVYGLQGSTLGRILLDLNFNPSMPNGWSLAAFYVALSRVTKGDNIRVLPWVHSFGTHHLEDLSHDPRYLSWLSAYDQTGNFQQTRLVHCHPNTRISTPASRRSLQPRAPSIASLTPPTNTTPVISEHIYNVRGTLPLTHSVSSEITPVSERSGTQLSLDRHFMDAINAPEYALSTTMSLSPASPVSATFSTSISSIQTTDCEIFLASQNTHSWAYVIFLADVMNYPSTEHTTLMRTVIQKYWSTDLPPLSDYEDTVQVTRYLYHVLDIFSLVKEHSNLPNHIDAPEQELLMGHIQALSSRPDFTPPQWLTDIETNLSANSSTQIDLDSITVRIDMSLFNLKQAYYERISHV